jgi:molybdenum cofactor synthesis domain-containing protein
MTDYPMILPEEALDIVLERTPILPAEEVRLGDALGRVLAEEVFAAEDTPSFPASAKDGFAVIAGDGSLRREIVGEQMAGAPAGIVVRPGTAARIMTGAPLPQGADAVVMVEYTEEAGGSVRLLRAVEPGQDVRPAGQDLAAGEQVLAAGTALGPPGVGLLAAVGRGRVQVYRRPRVAVLSTGDELVEPDQTLGPGLIRNSNRYALQASACAAGADVVWTAHARDEEGELSHLMAEALTQADVLLTSGGVSMGQRDLVKPLLREMGEVHFGRVAQKPGKPLTFATIQGRLAFGLPGFPVSSLVSFELYVRPALRKMQGYVGLQRPRRDVVLRHSIDRQPDRLEFQRAVVMEREGMYWAETTGLQVSGRLRSLVGANALLVLPARRAHFDKGETVEAILLDWPRLEADSPSIR